MFVLAWSSCARFVRSAPLAATLGAAVAACGVGCTTSVHDEVFGQLGQGDAGVGEGDGAVVYPNGPDTPATGTGDAGLGDTGGVAAACAPVKSGDARICVTLSRGAVGPSIGDDDAGGLGIDGNGVIIVGLSQNAGDDDATGSFAVWQAVPSAASGASLSVADLDTPKTIELEVPPGTYYLKAVFRDAQPYDRHDDRIGDYVPSAPPSSMTFVAGVGYPMALALLPLRGVDVEIALADDTTAVGAAAGPLGVRLVSDVGGAHVAAVGGVDCVDLRNDPPPTFRLLTTDPAASFDVDAALFDFATSLSDAAVVAWLADPTGLVAAPAGSLVVDDGTKMLTSIAPSVWLGPRAQLSLSKVVPFVGAPPVDPSPACYAVSASAPANGSP